MNRKIIFVSFFTLILLLEINCVQVFETQENSTNSSGAPSDSHNNDLVMELTTFESLKEDEKIRNNESEQNSDQKTTTSTTSTTTHIIPPTLLNTRIELNHETTEKPVKALKDL